MKDTGIIKKDGSKQRGDVRLSLDIANALADLVLSGKSLYPKNGKLELYLGDSNSENPFILRVGTLNTWITRENVIPETGAVLKTFLNEVRKQYRIGKMEAMREEIFEKAENMLYKALNLDPMKPVMYRGKAVVGDDGNPLYEVDADVLQVQLDMAKYVTERLKPEIYGKRDRTEQQPTIFSLADLRKDRREIRERDELNDKKP